MWRFTQGGIPTQSPQPRKPVVATDSRIGPSGFQPGAPTCGGFTSAARKNCETHRVSSRWRPKGCLAQGVSVSGSALGFSSSLVAAEARAHTYTHRHTHRHRLRIKLVYNKKKKENRNRRKEKTETKEIPDLCHISASDGERCRCVFLTRLLNVVHVQTGRTKQQLATTG